MKVDGKSIIELLSSISFGDVVLWLIVITFFISAICTATIKLYKGFTKYRDLKDENERYKIATESNTKSLSKVEKTLDSIVNTLNEQKVFNYKQARCSIVHTCDEALDKGEISASKYKSLMEMYDEYTIVFSDMHPNGYVKGLVTKINDPTLVKIVGTLNEE